MYTVSSSTVWFWAAVLATIALALFAVVPVSADVIRPINPTKVYFENNGTPVNEKVTFTVNCYGYHSSGAPPAQSKPSVSERVLSFSAICPKYGCTIFEDYDRYLDSLHIDSCDLEGELNGENFIIRNFGSTPVPNCTDLHQYGNEIKKTDIILDNHGSPANRMCTLRFAIPPERYVPTPAPIHTPTSTPVPISAHVVLVSVVLASGLAVMSRKKKTS